MESPRKRRARRATNGEGSVYQRKDGMWIGAAYVVTTTGHRKRITVSSRSRDEARRQLTRKIADSDAGIPVAAETWTVEDYLTYWLEHVVKPRRPKTYQGYEGIVRRYLVPELGRRKLHRLSAPEVKMMMTRVASTCRCCADGDDAARDAPICCAKGDCCGRTLSPRTVQFVHAVLRNALQNAVREEVIPRNVAKLVQVPSPQYRINRGLSFEQAQHLLTAAKADRLHALYVLALYYGMRRAELLGLRWVDLDFETGSLEIVQTLQRVDGALRFLPPKTATSARTIPLIPVVADALRQHRAGQNRERLAAGLGWTDSGLVFTSTVGTPLEPDNLRRSWYPLRKRIEAEGTRFHDLRHSCVTMLLALGVPPHIVQEIVGHADMSVTMGIYAHVSLDDKRAALGRLQERLG